MENQPNFLLNIQDFSKSNSLTDVFLQIFKELTIFVFVFSFDPEKRHVKFEGTLDKMNMLSNYDISGRILVLPLNGNGPSNITFGKYNNSLHPVHI